MSFFWTEKLVQINIDEGGGFFFSFSFYIERVLQSELNKKRLLNKTRNYTCYGPGTQTENLKTSYQINGLTTSRRSVEIHLMSIGLETALIVSPTILRTSKPLKLDLYSLIFPFT